MTRFQQITKWQLAVALAALVFLFACLLAYAEVGGSGFDRVLSEPWGLVTLLDVGLAALCMSAVVFARETDKRVALAWSLPIFVLGHVVSAAWVIIRFLPKKS